MNQTVEEFYKEVTEWLLPLGYQAIYSNHPAEKVREFHFIKDGVRVCCINSWNPHCYLQNDVLSITPPVSLRSGQYKIGFDTIEELTNILIEQELLLTKQPTTGLRIVKLPEDFDLEKFKKEWCDE